MCIQITLSISPRWTCCDWSEYQDSIHSGCSCLLFTRVIPHLHSSYGIGPLSMHFERDHLKYGRGRTLFIGQYPKLGGWHHAGWESQTLFPCLLFQRMVWNQGIMAYFAQICTVWFILEARLLIYIDLCCFYQGSLWYHFWISHLLAGICSHSFIWIFIHCSSNTYWMPIFVVSTILGTGNTKMN